MSSKSKIWGSLAGLGLLLSLTSGATAAMPVNSSAQTNQFRRVEQPLGLKVGVTAGGLALIGIELWWFLLSRGQGRTR